MLPAPAFLVSIFSIGSTWVVGWISPRLIAPPPNILLKVTAAAERGLYHNLIPPFAHFCSYNNCPTLNFEFNPFRQTKRKEMALKKQPASWSKWPLIALRLLQLLGVLIVFGVTGYFNYYLIKDGYKIPWEFIALDVVVRSTYFCSRGLAINVRTN